MSRNYYSEINLHFTWHTKLSRPLLTGTVEKAVHREIRQRLINMPGVFVHEASGTDTHVHVCVSIPPTVTVSELIGQLKGGSAHAANHQNETRDKVVEWPSGYGVVSFGTGDLEWVKEYVRNQREHHAAGKVYDRLERITEMEDDVEDNRLKPPQREAL